MPIMGLDYILNAKWRFDSLNSDDTTAGFILRTDFPPFDFTASAGFLQPPKVARIAISLRFAYCNRDKPSIRYDSTVTNMATNTGL